MRTGPPVSRKTARGGVAAGGGGGAAGARAAPAPPRHGRAAEERAWRVVQREVGPVGALAVAGRREDDGHVGRRRGGDGVGLRGAVGVEDAVALGGGLLDDALERADGPRLAEDLRAAAAAARVVRAARGGRPADDGDRLAALVEREQAALVLEQHGGV